MANILQNQPIVRIGMLGSVSHGKSTFINKVSGIKTQRHSSEKTRNITIKQGYANMKIWEHEGELITSTENLNYNLVNHVSFIDCPGHQEYIDVMLSSISMMDGVIVIVSADQELKQNPQLIQHLKAVQLYEEQIKNKVIVCINKIDLVEIHKVRQIKEELDKLLEEYNIRPYIVIPTSFNKMIGIKYVVKSIMELFNPLEYISQNMNTKPLFKISRSFDVNKPGTDWSEIVGGVLGGTLFSGHLKVGDTIEIRPGQILKQKDKIICQPFITTIKSIKTDDSNLNEIIPGGLIGIGTDLDPFYCKKDLMSGNVLGYPNELPNVYNKINILTEVILKKNDMILLSIGTKMCEGKVCDTFSIELLKPVCIEDNAIIIICKKVNKILQILGKGKLVDSIKLL